MTPENRGLTSDDRALITDARDMGRRMRARSGDFERLAGALIEELINLVERLAAQLAQEGGAS